ncbi:MAG: long-chain fatty acid--CoA ligase [Candidatus Falkowbacteria bacterium]
MESIYHRFNRIANTYASRPAIMWHGRFRWKTMSYQKLRSQIEAVASVMSNNNLAVGDRVVILSENRPEWLVADLACNKLGLVSVPIHFTSNIKTIEYILRNSGSRWLFVSPKMWQLHQSTLRTVSQELRMKAITVLMDMQHELNKDDLTGVITYKEMLDGVGDAEIAINNLASIVYTSGTTGNPKGVMLTNQTFLHNVDASTSLIPIFPTDRFMSFLPLSHVLERMAGSFIPVLSGASIGYARSIKTITADFHIIRPTVLISVPKIFERTLEKIIAGIRHKPRVLQRLFFCCLRKSEHGWWQQRLDRLFYHKIKGIFGGRLRFAICGGAAINERAIRFFARMGVTIYQGYGLTETSPVISVNWSGANKLGTTGKPLPGVMVKIGADKEVLVKGDNVMFGYWQDEDKTKEVFTEDGWLLTGDLGFVDHEGYLTIVGRKKDVIVMSNGKNVSPEQIESELNLSPYIAQSIVVGHHQAYLGAIVVPDYENLKQEFGEVQVDVKKLIGQEIERINDQMAHFEHVRKFEVQEQPFSIEKDELTPTLKIRRHIIEQHFSNIIAKLF